jgi:hypothetical protein
MRRSRRWRPNDRGRDWSYFIGSNEYSTFWWTREIRDTVEVEISLGGARRAQATDPAAEPSFLPLPTY